MMKSKPRGHGWARLVGAAVVIAAPLVVVAPAGASSTADGARILPPRNALHASGASALAATNSPYDITMRVCGDPLPLSITTRFNTLFAYGADGGDDAQGVSGGAGSVAVASYDLPVGGALSARSGCKGQSASAGNHDATTGGTTPGRPGGGDGGAASANGNSGGAGGGYSAWYTGSDALVEAGAGGGAGGLNGGAGGDGGHAGAEGLADIVSCCAQGGGGGAFDVFGADGAPGGHPGLANQGGLGGGDHGVGGGGGGAGDHGGGGGGGGLDAISAPGAGGGGGGSLVFTYAGYWAEPGGVGHGTGQDGVTERVTVRPVVRHASFPGRDVVRGIAPNGARGGGYEVLGSGEIRTFSQGVNPSAAHGNPRWSTDMARGIVVLPDRSGGYVVDRSGVVFPFSLGDHPAPPAVRKKTLWASGDHARGLTILPDGTGGYILGRDGRLYPFAIGTNPKPAAAVRVPTWSGKDTARGITAPFLDAHGVAGGWVADANGRLHPWGRFLGGPVPDAAGPTVTARGVLSFAGGAGGLLVDGAGNLAPFASPGLP